MKLTKVLTLVLGLSLTQFALSSPAGDSILSAEKALKEVQELGFAWSTTPLLIAKAKLAVKEGRAEDALKLASKALKETKYSKTQAQYADQHWQDTAP